MKNVHRILLFLLAGSLVFACTSEEDQDTYAHLKSEVYGIQVFTKLEDAQLCAKETGKPILLVFDLLTSSTRKSSDLLAKYIEKNDVGEDYAVVILFVDDKNPLEKQYEARMPNGKLKKITTIGDDNMLTQVTMFDLLATPWHAILNYNLVNLKEPTGYFSDEKMIEEFLLLE